MKRNGSKRSFAIFSVTNHSDARVRLRVRLASVRLGHGIAAIPCHTNLTGLFGVPSRSDLPRKAEHAHLCQDPRSALATVLRRVWL